MLQNILEEAHPSNNSTSTKLNFLQSQKQQLSQLIDQLNTSIRINKQTISKMAILTNEQITFQEKQTTFNQVIKQLNLENQRMRIKNQKLIEQIQARQCKLLLQNQVREESETEFVTILKQYQDKILQLRRSLQDKEFLLQEKQTMGMQVKKQSNYIEPKQQIMKLHSQNNQTKQLLKKIIDENGILREQNQKLSKKNVQNQFKINKLQLIFSNQLSYCSARQMYHNKKSASLGKLPLNMKQSYSNNNRVNEQQTMNKTQVNKTQNKGYLFNSTADTYYARNQTITSLRKIIFKFKQTESIIKKQIQTLQLQNAQLIQTNKLLRQSNLQHQIDRQKLQSQINFYQYKNYQLSSILTQRKGDNRRCSSNQKTKIDIIMKQSKTQIVPVQNRKQVQYYFNLSKYQLSNNLLPIDSNINRNYFKQIKQSKIKRSFSSIIDYVPKAQVDGVEKYLNKKNIKQPKNQQSKIDQFPFSIDYSVIQNKNSSPLTFADFRNKMKNKKFTESFMMITQEIIKM